MATRGAPDRLGRRGPWQRVLARPRARAHMTAALDPLLQLNDLKVHFRARRSAFWKPRPVIHAVDGVSLTVRRGTTFGIVGESGSGKTTAAMAILRLVRVTHGTILFDGVDLTALAGEELRRFRRRLQIVFQDPYSSLDPRRRGGHHSRAVGPRGDRRSGERKDRVAQLLEASVYRRPRGDCCRISSRAGSASIGIARALRPIRARRVRRARCAALDVAVQAQTLNLLVRLQRDLELTYVFISHDLGVVRHVCDRVAIMYLGRGRARAVPRCSAVPCIPTRGPCCRPFPAGALQPKDQARRRSCPARSPACGLSLCRALPSPSTSAVAEPPLRPWRTGKPSPVIAFLPTAAPAARQRCGRKLVAGPRSSVTLKSR